MSIEITMPRLSDTMERGTIVSWNVKEGDKVNAMIINIDRKSRGINLSIKAREVAEEQAFVLMQPH